MRDLITEREERKNAIVRRSVNLSKESHVVAANLDRAFLVATVSHPPRARDSLIVFWSQQKPTESRPRLVFNKCDLLLKSESRGCGRGVGLHGQSCIRWLVTMSFKCPANGEGLPAN